MLTAGGMSGDACGGRSAVEHLEDGPGYVFFDGITAPQSRGWLISND